MTFKRMLLYLKPHKKLIFITIFTIVISSTITIFTPKILGDFITYIYESIKNNAPINNIHLYNILITLSILYLTNIILNYFENYLTNNIGQKIIYTLRNETNKKLSKLQVAYYDTHSNGDILSRFNNDLEIIASLYIQIIPKIINYSITFIGTLIMMLHIDSLLTLITIIAIPLIAIISKILLIFSKKKKLQYFEKITYLNSVITESFINQEIISLYNNDELMSKNFDKLNKDLAKTNIKASLISTLLYPLSSLINYLVYLLIIIIGAKHVFEGKIKFGEIQTLIQYTKQLSNPINNFSNIISQTQTAFIAGNRIFQILDEKEEEHDGTLVLNDIQKIEFKNVDFSYTEEQLIKGFNLKINKGEKIAIVGETGSGKSTIVNILMQFYKIKNGEILINDIPIYKYDLKNYYKQISLIPQETWLLNDTIKNNLIYGNMEANEDQIKKVCLETNCLDFINSMPNKFDEIINENNQNISEGEKQLLTITRALLKSSSLLILDEATSSIDFKSENLIDKAIKNIDKNKITIIIAHKLSTITNADKIIVMKDGKIIEIGNHISLYK